MAKMGSDNLKQNLTNLAKAFLWDAMFVNPIGGGDSEALNVRCQSTSQPGRSFLASFNEPSVGVAGTGRARDFIFGTRKPQSKLEL